MNPEIAVKPRVRTRSGLVGPLEAILARIRISDRTRVVLAGPPGSGKSSALAFVGDRGLAPEMRLSDRPEHLFAAFGGSGPLIVASEASVSGEVLELQPWSDDECIEYLLAVHPRHCRSVMDRVKACPQRSLFQGHPHCWRLTLDYMAEHEAVGDVLVALVGALKALESRRQQWRKISVECFRSMIDGQSQDLLMRFFSCGVRDGERSELARCLRYRPVRLALAVDYLKPRLRARFAGGVLVRRWPRELIDALAPEIAAEREFAAKIEHLLSRTRGDIQVNVASLLVAARIPFKPRGIETLKVSGARLPRIDWSGVSLGRLEARGANFSGAKLAGVRIPNAFLGNANLAGADVTGAELRGAHLSGANLHSASFRRATLPDAHLLGVDAQHAAFDGANLDGARLKGARLENASFVGASLISAWLGSSVLSHTDLHRANLVGCDAEIVDFHEARLAGANFARARMVHCRLDGVEMLEAGFLDANLIGCDLTAARMPGAKFAGVRLINCGLADVDWRGADLRGANLTGSTFHMGSTRSGLVGSPIASEGSRTGFYTDESLEQSFQRPESIRKANLCGADLRGAQLTGVDLYLVDLRGAKLDGAQLEWARKCRAILGRTPTPDGHA